MKKLVSLNISQIKQVKWQDRIITTGIFKNPTDEKLKVQGVNIIGDDQADRSAHGGANKAIYAYPVEHYPYWKGQFPNNKLPYGMFGENLTTQGLLESDIFVGDRIRIGTTELIAVQPRVPCYKLGIRFGTQSIIKKFYQSDFSGIYFKIAQSGEIQVGDEIKIIEKDPLGVSIRDVLNIIKGQASVDQIKKANLAKHIPARLKNQLQNVLKR
ncbi:MAG: MOSC domain-containing protein [Candidatus Kariarchaeaceae archaeon]